MAVSMPALAYPSARLLILSTTYFCGHCRSLMLVHQLAALLGMNGLPSTVVSAVPFTGLYNGSIVQSSFAGTTVPDDMAAFAVAPLTIFVNPRPAPDMAAILINPRRLVLVLIALC